MHQVRQCFAVCPTFNVQPQLATLRNIPGAFPKEHVFTNVDDGVFRGIHQILKRQRYSVPTLLFVDDAAGEHATNKGNKGAFANLCLASPHLNLTIIGVFQRLACCSPALRDNAESLISFVPSMTADLKRLYEEYNPCVTDPDSKNILLKVLKLCWKKSRFAFIHRENRDPNVQYYSGFDERVKIT